MYTDALLARIDFFVARSSYSQSPTPQAATWNRPDFANKFMPYYSYTELENGLSQHNLTMFGLFALADGIALTYEVPLFSGMDITRVSIEGAPRPNDGDRS